MAKKKVDAQAELDREPSHKPPAHPAEEPKKAAGRTIGAWRKDALKYLGKGASDSDVTAHIVKTAGDNGYEYATDDAETAEWRSRVQAELDGGPLPETPRRSRGAAASASEPTLSDLLAVLQQLKDAELPETDGMSPVEAWSAIIDQVEAIASKVGGISNLKRCLTAASSLTALTGK